MNNKITLITGNKNKAKEFERLLGFAIERQKVELPEIQATDVRDVSAAKVRVAYEALGTAVFVDDTGLVIDAWGELPGALIRWFLDNVGNEGILKMLGDSSNRSARVITSIGYKDDSREFVVTGEVKGSIASEPKGQNGFGYDAIFIPEGCTKTFAEMTNSEKDAVSMRALAAHALREKLLEE